MTMTVFDASSLPPYVVLNIFSVLIKANAASVFVPEPNGYGMPDSA